MKRSSIISGSHLLLLLGLPLLAQTSGHLIVSAHMDIYRAGGFNDGSDGIAPELFVFNASPGQALAFLKVAGTWTCRNVDGVPYYGPDGTPLNPKGCPPESNPPIGPFGGYYATDYQGALVGMFLEDSLPTAAPASKRFYESNGYGGGIKTDFPALAPQIGEVFFIGDGLTGTGSGNIQIFAVPPTATHLYLGYVDGCQPGVVNPGCFADNGGYVEAYFAFYGGSSQGVTAH